MNITELKDKINSLNLLDLFPDIHGYGIALKEIKGITTDDLCVQFYVEKKKRLDQLSLEQVLPTTLLDFGVDVITDVKEAGVSSRLGDDVNYNEMLNEEQQLINYQNYLISKIEDHNNQIYTNTDTSASIMSYGHLNYYNEPNAKTTDPIRLNYLKNRPLLGGSSSIYIGGSDATLGLIVRDSTDDSIVALSNNHVYANSQFIGLCALGGNSPNTLTLSARQPSSNLYSPYGSSVPGNDYIGRHKRCVALYQNNSNMVDSAIVQLSSYSLIQALSTQVIGFTELGPYLFATTEEIDSLMDPNSVNFKAPIFRNGRTLGPIGYPGNLHSTLHASPVSATNITLLPFTSDTIKSIQYKNEGLSLNYPIPQPYPAAATVIVKTVTNDIYRSGAMETVPNQPVISKTFAKVGNFDYFDFNSLASYGLSSGKLMYHAPTGITVGNSWSTSSNNLQYTIAPAQLDSYINVSKIILSRYGSFILSGTSLYSIGKNESFQTIGTPDNATYSTWTKIPGDWKSIDQVYNGQFIALSSSGEMFFTCSTSTSAFLGSSFINSFTNIYNLTANKISDYKFKKLYFTSTSWSNLFNKNYGLSASEDKLITFTLSGSSTNTSADRQMVYREIEGEWGEDIKIIGTDSGTGDVNFPLILSGTKLYSSGTPTSAPFTTNYPKYTSFFNGVTTVYSTTKFSEVTGINVGDIVGFSRGAISQENSTYESLIFLSGGNWYCGGVNPMGIFGINYNTFDEIVMNTLAANVNVGGFMSGVSTPFTDCIGIQSKNQNFPIIQGGDSGTAVFALLSSTIPPLSTWKCIGLAFAGPSPRNTMTGWVCRIDNIVDQLKIKPWDGTIPTTQSKISNITYASTLTAIPTITLSGREYYNIGLS